VRIRNYLPVEIIPENLQATAHSLSDHEKDSTNSIACHQLAFLTFGEEKKQPPVAAVAIKCKDYIYYLFFGFGFGTLF
jgi:hypothetical protein